VAGGSRAGAGLKWALGISLVLNVFLVAGGIAALTTVRHHMHDMPRSSAGQAWDEVEKQLTPATRAHIREVVKTAALGTEGDWAKARELRQQAEALAHAPTYNAARIVDLAEQARSYENMSRAKIETALIQDMASLPPSERGVVAGYILRPGFRLRHLLSPGDPGPAPDGPPRAANHDGGK
jgi:uncharacterized membrane protein